MWLIELMFALVMALILMGLLFTERSVLGGNRLATFSLLLLGIWAFLSVMNIQGPLVYGLAWMPALFIAVALGLILAAASETNRRPGLPPDPGREAAQDMAVGSGLGLLFWVLIGLFIAAIITNLVLAG